jgi:AraC family transcriptional regulator
MGISKCEHGPEGYLEPGSYYGDVVARRDCGGVLLSELRHEAARRLPSHSHESAFFSLLLDGSYRERFANRTFEYKPFTVMFHRPGFSHRDEVGSGGGHFFMVEVPSQLLRRLQECSIVPDVVVGDRGSEISRLAIRLYHQYPARSAASELTVEGLIMEMLGQVATDEIGAKRVAPPWLDRAVDMLHAEFDRNLTVTEIAAFHLSRVLRRFYQQSIGEYTHRLRVEFACRELSKREARLADIAIRGGFTDQSHFCRVFKQVTGVTPGAFRNSIFARDGGTQ